MGKEVEQTYDNFAQIDFAELASHNIFKNSGSLELNGETGISNNKDVTSLFSHIAKVSEGEKPTYDCSLTAVLAKTIKRKSNVVLFINVLP